VQLLGDPATCPHGNPIPGSHNPGSTLQTVSLSEVQPGPIVVVRVSERLEQSGDALALVADAQLMPGCDATVITRDADGVVVKTTTGEFRVPTRVAEFLYVSPR
jgi:DtxR family Mn-dependent transcriptional regulator